MCIITRGNPGELYFPRGPPRELNRSSPIRLERESKDAEDHIGADNWPARLPSAFPLSAPNPAMPLYFSFIFPGASAVHARGMF